MIPQKVYLVTFVNTLLKMYLITVKNTAVKMYSNTWKISKKGTNTVTPLHVTALLQ